MREGFIKTNYHTHTNFCDGKFSAEEMIWAAIDRGINILGFSSHSMYPFAHDYHISPKEHDAYVNEIKKLATAYKDKIEIYCGFEADYVQGLSAPDMYYYQKFNPDYLIGSVHYVFGSKGFFEADGSLEDIINGIDKYFDGNRKEAVQTYFALQREMLEKCSFTFWAHPDLIRKQNAKKTLFDESESWYKKELKAVAKAAAKAGVIAEVNTGGIARGYLDSPYPSMEFLELLHENNVPVTFGADAHSTDAIDFWFEEAIQYIKKAGYTELHYFQAGSVKSQRI